MTGCGLRGWKGKSEIRNPKAERTPRPETRIHSPTITVFPPQKCEAQIVKTEWKWPKPRSTPQVVAEAISRAPDVVLSWALLAFRPSVSSGWACVWVPAQGREWRRGKKHAASAAHKWVVTFRSTSSRTSLLARSPQLIASYIAPGYSTHNLGGVVPSCESASIVSTALRPSEKARRKMNHTMGRTRMALR